MRRIDVRGLTCIGYDGFGPWRVDDGVLRAAFCGKRLSTLEAAQAVFDVYRMAHLATHATPDALELVRVICDDTQCFGVVVDYVEGVELDIHLAFGTYGLAEAAREIGAVQRVLNGASMLAGIDWKDQFHTWSRALAPHLPVTMGDTIVALVEAIPDRTTLVHGDLHIGNVVVSDTRLAPIDMERTGFGDPVFDLAISRSRLVFNTPSYAIERGIDPRHDSELFDRCWRQGWLRGYFDGASSDWLCEIDRRLAVLAEVEDCGMEYRIAKNVVGELSEQQARRVGQAAEELERLLPRIDRLDLSQ